MEEIEFLSWLTLDAIKNAAEVTETVGDLQTGHYISIFCKIEDDYLELFYSDTGSNYLRRYENKEEFETALEKRKKEEGEIPYEEDRGFEEDYFGDEEKEEDYNIEDNSEKY